MGKLLVAFVLGIVVTCSAFLLADRTELSSQPLDDSGSTEANVAPEDPVVIDDRSGLVRVEIERRPVSENADLAPENSKSRLQALMDQVDEARQFIADSTAEIHRLQLELVADEPRTFPLDLPPQLDWVYDDPQRARFHELIQREEKDYAWAEEMEQRIEAAIYARPEILTGLGAPTITCQTSRCQITFSNNYSIERPRSALVALGQVLATDLRNDVSRVEGTFWVEDRFEDGVTSVFWSLPLIRRDQNSN